MSCQFLLSVPSCRLQSGPVLGVKPVEQVARIDDLLGEGPRLWLGPCTSSQQLGHGGLIVGEIFDRDMTTERQVVLPLQLSGRPDLAGEWLVRKCWGAYFAVLPEPASGNICVFPDPSGLFPIYRLHTPTHTLVTCDVRLLAKLTAVALAVSWPELAGFLCWPELRQKATCLVGVDELVPGELVRLSGEMDKPRQLWAPATFLPGRLLPSRETATRQLHDLAVFVMKVWAQRLGPAAIAASGGVDSSFICAALAEAVEQFSCVTLATADPSGDESRFVRSLGSHLGAPFAASTYDAGDADFIRSASSGLPRPQHKMFMRALDLALERAARAQGAGVILDGNGGDNLFCYLHSAAPVADCLRVRGPVAETLACFVDMCQVTGASLPTMARGLLRRIIRGSQADRRQSDARLLNPEFSAPVSAPLRNWLDIDVGRHAGKRDHLALLMGCHNQLRTLPLPGQPRRFSPLASQPLVEFCLGIPTWYWNTGGINRSLARAAFGSVLPEAIVRRTSKSGPDSFIRALYAERRDEIAELLLGGLLAANGVLDRPAVEAALKTSAHSANQVVYRLLDLVEAEAWARSWQR